MKKTTRKPTLTSAGLERAARQAAGSALAVALAALIWLGQHPGWPMALRAMVDIAVLGALASAVWRRRDGRATSALARADFELSALVLLAVCEAALWAPGGLRGPFAGALYITFALVAAFARPIASVGAWALLALVLVALPAAQASSGNASWATLVHASAIGGVGVAVWWAIRRHVGGAEARARASVEQELAQLRDAARSYRLLALEGAAAGVEALEGGAQRNSRPDDPRLIRSSIDEIHAALGLLLNVCRSALACRTVLVLWLDASRSMLRVRAASSAEPELARESFSAREGLFGAALESGSARPLELVGAPAQRPLPYYREQRAVGHVGVVPILEGSTTAGLLAFDRPVERPFTPHELQILEHTSRLVRRTIDNERVVLQLDRAQLEQGKLYRAVERLNEARTEAQVIEAGVSSAREFTAFQFAAVTLLRGDGEHEICAVSGAGEAALAGETFRDASGLVGMVVENRHPLPFRGECDAGVQVLFTRSLPTPKLPSLLVLPLLVHGEVLGTLALGSEEPGGFGEDVRLILQVLAGHVAVSLANARMVARLEELATTDGLTQLLNKRALTDLAGQKLRAADRFSRPLSVMICDLDHFKKVNDTHGHDIGDRVIRGFAEILSRAKRETDTVGRFGGEEFVVVCEQTDTEGAELLAKRIRSELSATAFVTPAGGLRVTCSIGIATYPHAGKDWDALFKAADEALYASKRGGRDRVTLWSPRLRTAKAV